MYAGFAGLGSHDSPERKAMIRKQQAQFLEEQILEKQRRREVERSSMLEALKRERSAELRLLDEVQLSARSAPQALPEELQWPQLQVDSRTPPPIHVRRRAGRPEIDIDAEWADWESRNPNFKRRRQRVSVAENAASGTRTAAESAGRTRRPAEPAATASTARPAATRPAEPDRITASQAALRPTGHSAVSASEATWGKEPPLSPPPLPSRFPAPPKGSGRLAEELRTIASAALRDELQKLRRSCSEQREKLRSQAEKFRQEASRLLLEQSSVPVVPSYSSRALSAAPLPILHSPSLPVNTEPRWPAMPAWLAQPVADLARQGKNPTDSQPGEVFRGNGNTLQQASTLVFIENWGGKGFVGTHLPAHQPPPAKLGLSVVGSPGDRSPGESKSGAPFGVASGGSLERRVPALDLSPTRTANARSGDAMKPEPSMWTEAAHSEHGSELSMDLHSLSYSRTDMDSAPGSVHTSAVDTAHESTGKAAFDRVIDIGAALRTSLPQGKGPWVQNGDSDAKLLAQAAPRSQPVSARYQEGPGSDGGLRNRTQDFLRDALIAENGSTPRPPVPNSLH
eukprot:gnl/TRDRNA2_/TRDRNA2_80522_c0_seq1.p1 gnl/TRDRNA2_/TRDRNA2_80522_c0~~gnl/TRDRNA2_/TRDRNA2_80522_c0_seq1.p1  ORF type:complete len:569 (+),score=79.17 gnl/TRDRNA2_/TRDRNA2_80522_c0_seq1:170-1876(+)